MNANPVEKYILDTNTLINFALWLPVKSNKVFWRTMSESLSNSEWVLLDVVVAEIKFNQDLLYWCKEQKKKSLITSLTIEDRETSVEINNDYPMIEPTTFKSTVDTYIIAHAINNKLSVFTRESSRENSSKPYKIPDVCGIFRIKCIRNPENFLNSINYKN